MRIWNRIAPILVVACIMPSAWAAFTQADLEKIVLEFDSVGGRNASYIYPIKCSIADSSDVNAYATIEKVTGSSKPQAILVVYTGLIKSLKEDPRLIRAVISHEVSHLILGHCKTTDFVARDLSHLWTRQQEMAADVHGAKLLERSGYSKQDMIDMLMKLDKRGEREVSWIHRISSDHPNPKQRASEVAGNTSIFQSMAIFDIGLAYMQCRRLSDAVRLFDATAEREPKLTEALVNSAQAALMHYYDSLPLGVKSKWFRPDFGPVLSDSSQILSRDPNIRDSDRARYKSAVDRIGTAKSKLPKDKRVLELEAIANVGGFTRASLWSGTAASWVDLHPGGATSSVANGASGANQVGYASVGGVNHASLWSGTAGSWVDLHAFLPPGFSMWSEAAGITTDGVNVYIIGRGYNALTARAEALLWVRPNDGTFAIPTSYSILNGLNFGGNLGSLLNSDNNKVFVLCDDFDSLGEIQFISTLPAGTVNQLRFKFEGSASRNDLSQFVRMFNYSTNAYTNVNFQNSTIVDSVVEGTITTGVANYYSGTREVKSRVFWAPQADISNVDGWTQSCDQVLWTMN